MTKVVFSHGKESGPQGRKITLLGNVAKSLGFEVESIDYQDLVSPEHRVERLVEYIERQRSSVILVGSSMGGYVSTVASQYVAIEGLFLLAPALYMPGYNVQEYTFNGNISVVHGWNDNVIPVVNSIDYARAHQASLLLLNDTHPLANSLQTISPYFRHWLSSFQPI